MKRLLATCLLLVAVLPATGAAKEQPLFVLGRKGGTIKPFTVTIFPSGKVAVTGAVHRIEVVTLSPPALEGLKKLVQAEGFFSMPAFTNCDPTIGGIASNYVRVHIGKKDRAVGVVGGCNKRFSELFEVLKAVAAVSTVPR